MGNVDELAVEKVLGRLTAMRADFGAAEQAALDAIVSRQAEGAIDAAEVSLHQFDPKALEGTISRIAFDEAAAEYRVLSP